MYGWRARIGLILPMDNAVMEPELASLSLEGISFHAARILTTERAEMPTQGVEISHVFNEMGADLIVYACAETSFLKGVEGNDFIRREIERKTGLPALTATAAMVDAIKAVGASRISLITPYTAGRAAVMQQFLERHGIHVLKAVSRDFNEGTGEPREWLHTNMQPPNVAYQMARQALDGEAEAVVISATNFRTFEMIRALEQDLGKPVITTNQAIVWAALRRLGLGTQVAGLGALLQQP